MGQRLIDADKLRESLLAKGFYPAIVAREIERLLAAANDREGGTDALRAREKQHG